MKKVIGIFIEKMENEGCNNGNYPAYEIMFADGTTRSGITCRCCKGCSGTDSLYDYFESEDEFFNLL